MQSEYHSIHAGLQGTRVDLRGEVRVAIADTEHFLPNMTQLCVIASFIINEQSMLESFVYSSVHVVHVQVHTVPEQYIAILFCLQPV